MRTKEPVMGLLSASNYWHSISISDKRRMQHYTVNY
jgi:hypothetical protein